MSHQTLLERFRILAVDGKRIADEERARTGKDDLDLVSDVAAAMEWSDSGCPRYVLSDSTAALLSMTKAQSLRFNEMPYSGLILEIPSKYCSLPGAEPGNDHVRVMLADIGSFGGCLVAERSAAPGILRMGPSPSFIELAEEDPALRVSKPDVYAAARMLVRMVSNTIALITQYKESVRARNVARAGSHGRRLEMVADVVPPPGVTINRTLRDRARELAASRDLSSVKRSLRHVVRGHWKRQVIGAQGSQRKLIFVSPYERGDESFGRVAERIVRIHK